MVRNRQNTSFVGVPLFERESQGSVDATLRNIDEALNIWGHDASIRLAVNGPRTTEAGAPRPSFDIDPSKYNAEVVVTGVRRMGQVAAINALVEHAKEAEISRVFITDADIYRYPQALQYMWENATKPLAGARYRPYPVAVVEQAYGPLTREERLLYQIFDGDQTPLARRALRMSGIERPLRVKGSLMLIDADAVDTVHEEQTVASDSAINRRIRESEVVSDARFMHMGRVSVEDHITARYRHYAGAAQAGELDAFIGREYQAPNAATIDAVARQIRHLDPETGDFNAMLYLMRCALRVRVDELCTRMARGLDVRVEEPASPELSNVHTYEQTRQAVDRFLAGVDFDSVRHFSRSAPSVTQERMREPIDVVEIIKKHPKLAATVEESFAA